VVVDIRRSLPTFGEWESFDLVDERNLQLYVQIGSAHGFCALSEHGKCHKLCALRTEVLLCTSSRN
jgi:dTDP-4-dehydrorhamnose 3,5-epimerase